MADRAPTNSPKLAALRDDRPQDEGLDGLIRAHAAFVRKGEKRTTAIVADTQEMLDALQEKAARLAAPAASREARRRVDDAIRQLQEIQAAHIIAATGKIKRHAQAAAIETHEAVLEVADVDFGVSLSELSAAQLKAISDQRLLGASIAEYGENITAMRGFTLSREMQAAVALGESYDQIVNRLRTISDGTTKELTVLARTTVQAASNQAALETYAANEDILDGLVWVATLDNRTCDRCGPLDGREFFYAPKSGQDSVARMPRAPLHPQCRCFTAPLVTGMQRPKVPMWGDWIKRQPAETQDEVLGAQRAGLLRSGEVPPSEFITKSGALRSIDTLRRAA